MTKVITYGTYDLLHHGHIRLLERAKELGDYLIVGVTADDYDKTRGKINVQQSLMERIMAVEATGLADEIIVEEYEGQKIDDIRRHDVDIFTVGSDWKGHFDYLSEYCKVVYLERTQGVSSTEIRAQKRELRIGLVGTYKRMHKFLRESSFVNGVRIAGVCLESQMDKEACEKEFELVTSDYKKLLSCVDAVCIVSHPSLHYQQVKEALLEKKHVLCESPIALEKKQLEELEGIAKENGLVLMDGIKTAYSTAYYRLLLLAKTGLIGKIISIDATCTSLRNVYKETDSEVSGEWNSICEWGPTALLPIFQILGTNYDRNLIVSKFYNKEKKQDLFTKIDFVYSDAVASVKVGNGVKSEGELLISGTEGYIYVPAPWWKMDYFEIRFENQENNKRHFYQLDGEGIRYEIVAFLKSIETGKDHSYVAKDVSLAISRIMESFHETGELITLQ